MEDKDLIQKTEIQKLDDNIDQIAKDLIVENDSDKSNDLINLFNWNISKKNALRIIKLNQLYNQDRKTLRRFKYNMPITKLKKSNTIRRAMNSKLMLNMTIQLKK